MDSPEQKLLTYFGLKLVKQPVFFFPPNTLSDHLNKNQRLHEVAHYQVSSPSRRNLINFGLGYDSMGTGSKLPDRQQITEETRALLLTLFWADKFNWIENQKGIWTFPFKGMRCDVAIAKEKQNLETRKAHEWLLEKGLLDQNNQPILTSNSTEDPR